MHRLALQLQVNSQLALAVIAVESGLNAAAVSLNNAQGLMRLVFGTAQRFNVKNAFEPAENLCAEDWGICGGGCPTIGAR